MSGVQYDGDAERPSRRSSWVAIAAVAAVVLVAVTRGVIALVFLAWVAVLVGLVVAVAVAGVQGLRGSLRASGDHRPPGLKPGGGPASQRADAGHVSPSTSRS
jgi:hypothetical protein